LGITDSISSAGSPFTIQAGRELLAALQTQDQSVSVVKDFNQALASTNPVTDTVELLPASQRLNADPTSSALFQAHLGTPATGRVSTALTDSSSLAEDHGQLKVTGIAAATAAGPFANGESSQPDHFRLGLPSMELAQASQYPTAAGVNGYSGTYGTKTNFQIGARMDLKG
jgi:hypothetical protein